MSALPMKPQYGPSLGALLAPRWRAARPRTRRAIVAAGIAAVALLVGLVLTLLNATYSHGAPVPFHFSYRGMYRVAPDPGGYVKIQSRRADGSVRFSFAVAPLTLPPYEGELAAELPLVADGYISRLARRDTGFMLRGEGKAKVNGMTSAYAVFYTTIVGGRRLIGRDILLLPERTGARRGVALEMLATPGKGAQSRSPMEVGVLDVLARPFKSFSFG